MPRKPKPRMKRPTAIEIRFSNTVRIVPIIPITFMIMIARLLPLSIIAAVEKTPITAPTELIVEIIAIQLVASLSSKLNFT